MTTIPPLQRAVIDLTRSRSSTPDNRPTTAVLESNSTAPPELRTSISSKGEPRRQEENGKQNGEIRAENDVFSMGGFTDKRSLQLPTTEKSPAAAPPSQVPTNATPPRSPSKEKSDLEKENRHSVDRLLVK